MNMNEFGLCVNEYEYEYYSIQFISIRIFFIWIGALETGIDKLAS